MPASKRRLFSFLTAAFCAAVSLLVFVGNASAANYPCSGRKGGVSHCQGALFVCNDGSISGSKKVCSAEGGGGASKALGLTSQPRNAQGSSDASGCSCRSGNICTGPRGGRYCITDGGNKSYVRR